MEWISEDNLRDIVDVLVRLIEAGGAFIIFLGAGISLIRFVAIAVRTRRPAAFDPVRLDFGRFGCCRGNSNAAHQSAGCASAYE